MFKLNNGTIEIAKINVKIKETIASKQQSKCKENIFQRILTKCFILTRVKE